MVWEKNTPKSAAYSDIDGRLGMVYIPLLEFNGQRPPAKLTITIEDTKR